MKNGGLEAQLTPDLLMRMMFALGTIGTFVGITSEEWIDSEGHKLSFNPTELILSAFASNLELIWYSRCKALSVEDIRIHMRRACDVADAFHTRLRTAAKFIAGENCRDLSVKRHIWRMHMPDSYERKGANVYNDAALMEHGHKDDKDIFNRTSKR